MKCELFRTFMDPEKPYDTVNIDAIWKVLEISGVASIKIFYEQSSTCITLATNVNSCYCFSVTDRDQRECFPSQILFCRRYSADSRVN